jgi:cation diffusion facilitator family transporter
VSGDPPPTTVAIGGESAAHEENEFDEAAELERRTLWILLAINGAMFLVEAVAGWLADAAGLVADSLDMLADASVYGIVLYAVGRSRRLQADAAFASGVVQIALGAGVVLEVARRLVHGSEPVSALMMVVGAVALAANVTCLILVARHRDAGVHMRASYIFSANDVVANVGVIVAGALVLLLGSRLPDLVVGAVIAVVVVRGGIEILRQARAARRELDA